MSAAELCLSNLVEYAYRLSQGQIDRNAEIKSLREALQDLLKWAERYRGGDPSLDPEEYFIARDHALIALTTESALQRPTPISDSRSSGCPPPESSQG